MAGAQTEKGASGAAGEDVPKPKHLNYEEELEKLRESGKALSGMVVFPDDDLEVVALPKRTDGHLGPEPGSDAFHRLEPSHAESISFFHAPWRVVVRKYADVKYLPLDELDLYGEDDGATAEPDMDLSGPFESHTGTPSTSNHHEAGPITVSFEYFRTGDERALEEAAKKRRMGRAGIVRRVIQHGYAAVPAAETLLDCNRVVQNHKDPDTLKIFHYSDFHTRILVKPKSWSLGVGIVEPFYFRAALFDVMAMEKVSEDVYFDMNSPQMRNLIPQLARSEPHRVLKDHQLLFNNVEPNPNLYLCITVLKVPDLHAFEGGCSLYNQAGTAGAASNMERIRAAVNDACFHNGLHLQLFAWSAVRVFDDQCRFLLEEPQELRNFSLFTSKTVLLDEISGLHAGEVPSKRVKAKIEVVQACLEMVVMLVPPGRMPVSRNTYDPSMRRIMLSADESKEHIPDTKALYISQDFPTSPPLSPHLDLTHNAYVYPLRADIWKYLGSKEARGLGNLVAVRVSFHESDADPAECSSNASWYGRSHEDVQVPSLTTSVCIGPKQLVWSDELKLALPLYAKEKQHIRFTLLALSPLSRKDEDDKEVERIIGWAWLHLTPGMASSQVCKVYYGRKIPPKYLSSTTSEGGVTGSLVVQVKVVSTLTPLDPTLCGLFKYFHFKEFFLEDETQQALGMVAQNLNPVEAIRHLPMVFVALLRIMCSRSNGARPCEVLLTVLVRIARELGTLQRPREGLLNAWIEYGFNGFASTSGLRFPVYFSLCANLLVALMIRGKAQESQPRLLLENEDDDLLPGGGGLGSEKKVAAAVQTVTLEELYYISWWFFDLAVRSFLLEKADMGDLNQEAARVGDVDFLRLVNKLVGNSVKTIVRGVGWVDINSVVQFNSHLGTFMVDLFAVADRGFVIDVVWQYLNDMTEQQMSAPLSVVPLLKYDVIRILMDYEHWVALNLPISLKSIAQFRHYHQLTQAVAEALVFDLGQCGSTFLDANSELEVRGNWFAAAHYGVHVLLAAFAKHECDARLQGRSQRAMLSQIYLPLVLVLCKEWHAKLGPTLAKCSPLLGLRRNLYLAVLWVLEGLKRALLKRVWKGMSEAELSAFWAMLEDMLVVFSWSPTFALDHLPAKATALSVFSKKGLSFSSPGDSKGKQLCAHVTLQVLDLIEMYLETCSGKVANAVPPETVLSMLGNVFVTALAQNQGSRVLHCYFDSLHIFSLRYRHEMWAQRASSGFAQGLIRETLRYCNSMRADIRAEAVALLYLSLRANRAEMGNFERCKVLATTALATLVGAGRIEEGGVRLKRSMEVLSQYAMVEYVQAPEEASSATAKALQHKVEYSKNVQGLARGLCRVLDDSIMVSRVRERDDYYAIADLYFDICNGYDLVADLRITWLRSLAEYHKEQGRNAEAGMCMLRSAMLVLNFLSQQASSETPPGKLLFEKIMPGAEEYADVTGDESCQTSWFTSEGYSAILEEASACFVAAQMYEYAEDIQLLALLPMRESLCQYALVADCHRNLASFYQRLEAEGTTRFLGRFFRVGFYGQPFGPLNGREFVYREPGAQHLFSLKDMLTEHFETKFGSPVEVAKDSAPIAAERCDSPMALLQLTSLRALPGVGGLASKKREEKYFKEWTGVTRFAFDTPFQKKEGSSHAATSADQWKRTTVLEVRYPFPYVLARQPVIARSEFEVSPIELAIESLSSRCSLLTLEATRTPINVQQLQQVLGGSVSVSVNSGPVEFCEVFLESSEADSIEPEHVAELRFVFREFLDAVQMALDVHSKHVSEEMQAYHAQMEADFSKLQQRLLPTLVGELTERGMEDEYAAL